MLPHIRDEVFVLGPEQADLRLGFEIARVERSLASIEGVETWHSKGSAVFQTPYSELAEILDLLSLPLGAKLVDLGAAYGRLGVVCSLLRPDLEFQGFEICPERVEESRRIYALHGWDPARMQHADLAAHDFAPPEADAYLIYDYGTTAAVEKTLEDLKNLARNRAQGFRVVGRGRRIRDLVERANPWLSKVHDPMHYKNFSIYRA
jgi:hypothetical protein